MRPTALPAAVARRVRGLGRRAGLALAPLPLLAARERAYDRDFFLDAEHLRSRNAAGLIAAPAGLSDVPEPSWMHSNLMVFAGAIR